MMKLAVMQPYIFPYIGYFQLIQAVNTFVFYDDVNYIKGGWINRNRILMNGKDFFLTVPCQKASPNRQIKDILFDRNRPEFQNLLKNIYQAYRKAPYFENIYPITEAILNTDAETISELAIQSIIQVSDYLKLNRLFKVSSCDFAETKGMDRTDRLIEICRMQGATQYINAVGGIELYDKTYFKNAGIELSFIKTDSTIRYKQGKNDFVPWLSIIDVLMYNDKEEVKKLLTKYRLV